uniref:LRR-RLK n=1 Tax=Vernicia fordii TaxID=73154 RepID=A0A127AUK4_VERFO|nr:LRR-RLK [Vernicia fordii]
MGNNGSIILIPILIFLLRWQLVSGAGPAGNTYSGDPDGKYGSGNPYSGYPNGQGFGLSGKLQATYCGQNQTLPCAEVNALQAVINGFRLLPTIYISSTYCGYRLTTINCTCYRDDKNFILCHITEIYMSSKDLSGYIDPAISGLQFLKILELSNNQLTGSIPASLGNLTNLERLYIINNQLVGSIPESFKNLKSLKILDLSSNYLDGPIPSLRDLQNLNTIGLRFNFLNGPIPASLGNLSSLQILNLYSNILSGPIPDDLGNLTQLQFLALDDNELNGKLPEAFGKLSNITALWLGSNYISGNIPQNYSYLTGLQIFSVAGNDLSGKIPDYIAKWKNLTALILLGNNFDGNLPEGIFKLEKLQTLWVSGLTNPGFAFPKQEKLTTNLYSLILRNCSINGTIPSYIAQWLSLTNLDLSFNNLIGEIPKFSPYLKKIFLTRNKLNGTLPPWIINEHNAPERTNDVALMDLSNNDFANVPSVNHENGTLSDSPNSIIEPRR